MLDSQAKVATLNVRLPGKQPHSSRSRKSSRARRREQDCFSDGELLCRIGQAAALEVLVRACLATKKGGDALRAANEAGRVNRLSHVNTHGWACLAS